MKIAIAGMNSNLGVSLIQALQKDSHDLFGIYFSHPNPDFSFPQFPISNIPNLKGIETLFLVGAYIPRGKLNVPDTRFIDLNISAIISLSRQFSDARLVFCSSVAVYGMNIKKKTEHSAFVEPDVYGLSKIAGECIVRQFPRYSIVRFSSIYGPHFPPNNFINRIVLQAKEKRSIIIFGKGKRRQNYIHVRDATDYLIIAMNHQKNGIFLGVSNKSHSNLEAARLVRYWDKNVRIIFTGEDFAPSSIYDNSETRTALGIEKEIALKDGVRELMYST